MAATLSLPSFPPALLSFLYPRAGAFAFGTWQLQNFAYLCSRHTSRAPKRKDATSTSQRFRLQHTKTTSSKRDGWKATIGLELHVQLRSDIKLFSHAATSYEGVPNRHVTFLDAALPGSLPVLNPEPVRLAILAALALKCDIHRKTRFDRKHYFYPDLPAGFQITQKYSALATGGRVTLTPKYDGLPAETHVGITQLQLEQDTAKSMHEPTSQTTLIDLNRAGAALVEIVSEPDMTSAEEAAAYVRKVQSLLRCVGSSNADMEKGSMRIDVNVSVARSGSTALGKRCEIKNLNSIRSMVDAIEYEIDRHIGILTSSQDGNAQVEQETRGFDAVEGTTHRLRSKAETPDYRYMPDPELAPLVIPESVLDRLRDSLPELPDQIRDRLEANYGLKSREADILVKLDETSAVETCTSASKGSVSFFEQVAQGRDARTVANWIIHELLGILSKSNKTISENPVSAQDIGLLIDAVSSGKITATVGKALLADSVSGNVNGQSLPAKLQGAIDAVADASLDYSSLAQSIVTKLPEEADKVRRGNKKVLMRLIGEGMKISGGQANAKQLREELEKALSAQ